MNSVCLAGRLVADPELRYSQGGLPVTKFRIAISRPVPKGPDGRTPADFIPITAFGRTAEVVAQYAHKGDLVSVAGAIATRQYQDRDGVTRSGWGVVAARVGFLAKKNGHGHAAPPTAAEPETVTALGDEPEAVAVADLATADEDVPF